MTRSRPAYRLPMSAGPSTGTMKQMADAERPDARTLVAFVILIVLAGGNAVGIKIIGDELAAFWGAVMRFAAAGSIFAALMLVWRVPIPRGQALVGAVVYGLL